MRDKKYNIRELFMAKADKNRKFIGILKQDYFDGSLKLRTKINVNDGFLYSAADNKNDLIKYVDDICKMKLDFNLHENQNISISFFGDILFNLN